MKKIILEFDSETGAYHASGKPDAPFIYIDADRYYTNPNYKFVNNPLVPRVFSTFQQSEHLANSMCWSLCRRT